MTRDKNNCKKNKSQNVKGIKKKKTGESDLKRPIFKYYLLNRLNVNIEAENYMRYIFGCILVRTRSCKKM